MGLLRYWDKIRYFPMVVPFIKADIEDWWKGLGNDW